MIRFLALDAVTVPVGYYPAALLSPRVKTEKPFPQATLALAAAALAVLVVAINQIGYVICYCSKTDRDCQSPAPLWEGATMAI